MKEFIIVSGASQNHYISLRQFLGTVNYSLCTCYVFDLGLNERSKNELSSLENINLRTFKYEDYPPYYNIRVNAGEYAWKPAIIKNLLDELESTSQISPNTVILWCDAGDKLPLDMPHIYNYILSSQIYSPSSSGTIRTWTHRGMLEYFSINNGDSILGCTNRNGAIIGFAVGHKHIRDFINRFAELAAIKDCIAPEGSSRANHRQDQALFTILYYKFLEANLMPRCTEDYLGIRIHCDID